MAELVARATDGADAALVAAAVLQDSVEDAGVTAEELRAAFGQDVTELVLELTDNKKLLPAERKRLQIEMAPGKSQRAKVIKLADKTSNVRSLLTSPPATWSAERITEYLAWARQVVAGLRGASPQLEAWFDEAAAALERRA